MKHSPYLLIILLLFSSPSLAETLEEKVARNSINCLVGHISTNSEKYQSGETSAYIFLSESIIGADETRIQIETTSNKIDMAVELMGSSKEEEGHFLRESFCPAIDKIISEKE